MPQQQTPHPMFRANPQELHSAEQRLQCQHTSDHAIAALEQRLADMPSAQERLAYLNAHHRSAFAEFRDMLRRNNPLRREDADASVARILGDIRRDAFTACLGR